MLVGPPSEGVSNGSVGSWLTGERALMGAWKLVSFGLCVFSGSFGVRSIVLCKCLGKYIDIYFILKITFHSKYTPSVLYSYRRYVSMFLFLVY